MSKLIAYLFVSCFFYLLTSTISYAKVKLIAPKSPGVVLGDHFHLEVKNTNPADENRPWWPWNWWKNLFKKGCHIDDLNLWINGKKQNSKWMLGREDRHWFASVFLSHESKHHEIRVEGDRCGEIALRVRNDISSPLELGDGLALHKMEEDPSEKLDYDWVDGVFLDGLTRYASVSSHRNRITRYIDGFFRHHYAEGVPRVTSPDLAAPALAASEMQSRHKSSIGYFTLYQTRDFLRYEPRNELGALDHIGKDHKFREWLPKTRKFTREAIWADSMMMYGVTGLKLAQTLGDKELLEFSLNQAEIFVEYLSHPSGLFKHAYRIKNKTQVPEKDIYWLRGNGWMLASLIEMLPELERRDQETFERILEAFQDAVYSLKKHQYEHNHLWNTLIINREGDGYVETSGSALVGYAIARAVRLGYLPKSELETAENIFRGLALYLQWKPGKTSHEDRYSMKSISGPTNAAKRRWRYFFLVFKRSDLGYGVGPFLQLAKELHLQGVRF